MYLDSNHGHLGAKQTTEPHVQKYCKLKNFITVIMIRKLILKKLRKCKKISWRVVDHKLIKTSKMLMLAVLKYTFLSIHKCRSLYVSTFSNVEMKIELELDMSHSTAS